MGEHFKARLLESLNEVKGHHVKQATISFVLTSLENRILAFYIITHISPTGEAMHFHRYSKVLRRS